MFSLDRQTAREHTEYQVRERPAQRPRRHRSGPWEPRPARNPERNGSGATGGSRDRCGFRGFSEWKSCAFKYRILINGCTLRQCPVLNSHSVWYGNWMYFSLA